MKHQSKLSSEQQHEQTVGQKSAHQPKIEFASAEELLRHDAAQIPVPKAIAERLQKSAATLPPPKSNWWKRWLGGNS